MRKRVVLPMLVLLAFALLSCSFLTPVEQDLLTKIAARRFGAHGAQTNPEIFTKLGNVARDACDRPGETLLPSQALEMIAEAVGLQLGDPLLAADLKDLVSILGVRFNAGFQLVGLTQEQERLIKIAVCSFADGVQLYT